jgi:glycine cleavage system H protein
VSVFFSVVVELPEAGEEIIAGESFGEVEAVKTVSELFAPISGTICAVNEDLEDNPELINSDPYGDGWIIQISFSDLSELDMLLDVDSYRELVE